MASPYRAMELLSKMGPSGVSNTGTYKLGNFQANQHIEHPPGTQKNIKYFLQTFPMGFILRNSGVLFVTPISKFLTNSTFTPVYSAVISALKAFLLVFPACNT